MAHAVPEAKPLTAETAAFYTHAFDVLEDAEVPYLLGGAYALQRYTGIERDTKDMDAFVRPRDVRRALAALSAAGYHTELAFPHWLGKAFYGDEMLDVIFSSGNAVAKVDDTWFAYARPAEVLGRRVGLVPPEEMIWSKSFVQERERYDGADIAHIIRAEADRLEWDRLVSRFGDEHYRVLLSHLVLFGFVYPAERTHVPERVMRDLLARLGRELGSASDERECRGTLLSREQYLVDVEGWGYADARRGAPSEMTPGDIERWTADID